MSSGLDVTRKLLCKSYNIVFYSFDTTRNRSNISDSIIGNIFAMSLKMSLSLVLILNHDLCHLS